MKKFLFVFFSMVIMLCGCSESSTDVAFIVNDIESSKDELVFYMRRSSDVVIAIAEEKYGLDGTTENFWNEPMGDTTPIRHLQETAQKEIIRQKVMQISAKEYGIDSPLTYEEQQSDWKKDNEDRHKKEQAGELVYGATLRPFYTYLTIVLSEVEKEYKSKLVKDGIIKVSEQELKKYYLEHPDYFTGGGNDYESNKQSIYNWIFDEKYEKYLDELVDKSKIEYNDVTISPDLLD